MSIKARGGPSEWDREISSKGEGGGPGLNIGGGGRRALALRAATEAELRRRWSLICSSRGMWGRVNWD